MWKAIPGFECYEAHPDGLIRRVGKDKCLSPFVDKDGYKSVNLSNSGKRKRFPVHQAIALTFHPDETFDGAVVRHLNGNKPDVCADNLKWGTNQENADDRNRHGISYAGESNPNCKLSEVKVREILADNTSTPYELAEKHGVSHVLIRGIQKGTLWKHLHGNEDSNQETRP